jgi:hypothetical protein
LRDIPTWFWYELMTTDPTAATGFYAGLLGWKTEAYPDPGMQYTVVSTAAGGLGGIATLSAEAKAMGVPPNWMGVVRVSDTDAAAGRCKELGGAVHVGPFDIPNVGRYAVLADPTGAAFSVLQPAGPDGDTPTTLELGRVSWNELWTSDCDAAWAFYQAMFGWVETGKMDMGPQGVYRMYGLPDGKTSLGGIAARMPEQPANAWIYYFNVADIVACAAALQSAGGRVIMGPHDVPGGKILIAMDPQGAVFAAYSHGNG